MSTPAPPAASPTHTDSSGRTMGQEEREARPPSSSFSDDSDVDTEIEFEPIPADDDLEFAEGPLEPPVPTSQVSHDPIPLHVPGLQWVDIDLNNAEQMDELHGFLVVHYVQDAEEPYRYDFTPEFLRWALIPPGYNKDWHISVRESDTGELVAFIAGVPLQIRIRNNIIQTCAISFLCVHQRYRGKHLAPVLMSEISRRAQLRDVHQRFYTTGTALPRAISNSQFYHRPLNFEQLNAIGYLALPEGRTLDETIAFYTVPDSFSVSGLREMREDDVPAVTRLWADFSTRYSSAAVLSEPEIQHYLLSGPRTRDEGRPVFAYVVEDAGTVTDFISFYALRTVALESPDDPPQLKRILDGSYLYYYASSSTGSDEELKARLTALIADVLVIAQRERLDGLNCLSVMDNCLFCEEYDPLKFETGTAQLKWYLENYRAHPLAGRDATADAPPGRGLGVLII